MKVNISNYFPVFRIDAKLEDGGSTQWNAMEPKDFLQPRIFLCKSSRFLRNLNSQVDPDGERGSALPQRDSFGNEDFAATCDPRHLVPKESENEISDEDDEDETSTDTTVRIFF